jgi:hypothetical protein
MSSLVLHKRVASFALLWGLVAGGVTASCRNSEAPPRPAATVPRADVNGARCEERWEQDIRLEGTVGRGKVRVFLTRDEVLTTRSALRVYGVLIDSQMWAQGPPTEAQSLDGRPGEDCQLLVTVSGSDAEWILRFVNDTNVEGTARNRRPSTRSPCE